MLFLQGSRDALAATELACGLERSYWVLMRFFFTLGHRHHTEHDI